MPIRMNPRFRMMLVIAYGMVAAVNGGKAYVTQSILDLNYTAWIGLVWNGFYGIKWALFDRSKELWADVKRAEIDAVEILVAKIDDMINDAETLPTAD